MLLTHLAAFTASLETNDENRAPAPPPLVPRHGICAPRPKAPGPPPTPLTPSHASLAGFDARAAPAHLRCSLHKLLLFSMPVHVAGPVSPAAGRALQPLHTQQELPFARTKGVEKGDEPLERFALFVAAPSAAPCSPRAVSSASRCRSNMRRGRPGIVGCPDCAVYQPVYTPMSV